MDDERTSEKRVAAKKTPGTEVSINWEDDDNVEGFTFSNQQQAAYGIARIEVSEIERLNKLPGSRDRIAYERDAIDKNPYHGNIVYLEGTSKPQKRMICGALALASEYIPRR